MTVSEPRKILLLDDEPHMLDLYQDVLARLPSKPVIYPCDSGSKALALLDSEPFNVLVTDLNMPKIDGLQVLAVVRRKHPGLKVLVLTSVMDENFRTRAYSLGADVFWQKPGTEREVRLFLECVEGLLAHEQRGGFRGVQCKTLVDLIQLECMSLNSCVLRITNGAVESRIWIQKGEIVDATMGTLGGEEAFKTILAWKSGHFESLPAEQDRPRTIFASYQGLLLNAAQELDEDRAMADSAMAGSEVPAEARQRLTPLQASVRINGVAYLLAVPKSRKKEPQAWGVENPAALKQWMQQIFENFYVLGDTFAAGDLKRTTFRGTRDHLVLVENEDHRFCIGLQSGQTPDQSREIINQVLAQWAS